MPIPLTGTIDDWSKLAKMVEDYREKGWLFRGEDRPNKMLRPKVGREDTTAPGEKRDPAVDRRVPYTSADELRALRDFKKTALPYVSPAPSSDLEWLALGQHFGLPTRLLDWTEGLLAAAFFAVEQTGRHGDGAILYCVKGLPEIDEEQGEQHKVFELTETKLYRPPHISARMTAQRSVFTVHPTPPTQDFTHQSLERWLLPQRACWNIKRNLYAAGIYYSSIKPDLDGVSKQIAWLYKWGFFGTNQQR